MELTAAPISGHSHTLPLEPAYLLPVLASKGTRGVITRASELGERTKSGGVAHHVPCSSSRRSTCQTSEQRARSALSAPLASDHMQRAQRFECGRRISSASYRSEDAGGHLHDQDHPMSLPGQSDNMLPPT